MTTLRCVLACLLVVSLVQGFPRYAQEIPNGNSVPDPNATDGTLWPGVGHTHSAGGGELNPFGKAFKANGFKWTEKLCRNDSDGDGLTNGQELGDPNCIWKKGDTPTSLAVSHPGVPSPNKNSVSRPNLAVPKPGLPESKPSFPNPKPGLPESKPNFPVPKSGFPVPKPPAPAAKSAVPLPRLVAPVQRPAALESKPAAPAPKPAAAAPKPAGTVSKPAGPVLKPGAPVHKPAVPFTKPAVPAPRRAVPV